MKRILALLLAILTLLPLLAACGGGGDYVTEEEILPVARDLIERSVPVNVAFLGEGIPTKVGSTSVGKYFPADDAWMETYGIASLDELKEAAESVYTSALISVIYAKAFPEGELYYEYQERSIATGKGILVLEGREPLLSWYTGVTHEYHYDTMRMTDAGVGTAKVKLDVTVTKNGESQTRALELKLVLTENGWRCDNFTPVAFLEPEDQ